MSTTENPQEKLTEEERSLFERIAARSEEKGDEEMRRICEVVLQSSSDNEVTKS